jgi:hypothetical protein
MPARCVRIDGQAILPATMDWSVVVPAIIGSLVGVMGWLLVGMYIQRRQFVRQARNAAKAVYFELDVNLATISVARDHGVFSDLDRSSFERLLPELATLLSADELRTVVDAYMTHAGYRQLATGDDVPADVRRAVLARFIDVHARGMTTLRMRVFSAAEARVMTEASARPSTAEAVRPADSVARTKP